MAGSKRSKIKQKANDFIDSFSPSPPPPVEDDGLIDDLLSQMDQSPETQPEVSKVLNSVAKQQSEEAKVKKDPKRRFLDRQARKAAALASTFAPDDKESDDRIAHEKLEEERAIQSVCDSLGLEMYEINPDGHCLYSAIADQLALLQIIKPQHANYRTTRLAASAYMLDHQDDFLPFLPCLEGEDGAGATASSGLMTPELYAQYCAAVRDSGAWGGEPEITALCKAYNVPIHVAQWGQPKIVCHSPDGREVDPRRPSVKLSYHRRMYGLGEHYNSLRPKRTVLQAVAEVFNGS